MIDLAALSACASAAVIAAGAQASPVACVGARAHGAEGLANDGARPWRRRFERRSSAPPVGSRSPVAVSAGVPAAVSVAAVLLAAAVAALLATAADPELPGRSLSHPAVEVVEVGGK